MSATTAEAAVRRLYLAYAANDIGTIDDLIADDAVMSALAEFPQTCSLKFPTRGIGVGVSVGS
ncbi:MAG: hypothetical protein NVS3B26_15280 [Mycobacteriales bacterium]